MSTTNEFNKPKAVEIVAPTVTGETPKAAPAPKL